MRAFAEGVLAGLGIAVPVGAIAVLIVDLAMRRGFARAVPAALGAASADLTYAAVAAVAGTPTGCGGCSGPPARSDPGGPATTRSAPTRASSPSRS